VPLERIDYRGRRSKEVMASDAVRSIYLGGRIINTALT